MKNMYYDKKTKVITNDLGEKFTRPCFEITRAELAFYHERQLQLKSEHDDYDVEYFKAAEKLHDWIIETKKEKGMLPLEPRHWKHSRGEGPINVPDNLPPRPVYDPKW